MDSEIKEISKSRLIVGIIVFIIGFASPLFIPLVTNSNLQVAWKTGLSALLAFGIPEVFIIVAVAIMGKAGYTFLKSKLADFLQPLLPPDSVSLTRYRLGLIMFSLPILAGWVLPYIGHFSPLISDFPISYYVATDVVFLTSFFVLGGDFWDKFSGLFSNSVKVSEI